MIDRIDTSMPRFHMERTGEPLVQIIGGPSEARSDGETWSLDFSVVDTVCTAVSALERGGARVRVESLAHRRRRALRTCNGRRCSGMVPSTRSNAPRPTTGQVRPIVTHLDQFCQTRGRRSLLLTSASIDWSSIRPVPGLVERQRRFSVDGPRSPPMLRLARGPGNDPVTRERRTHNRTRQ